MMILNQALHVFMQGGLLPNELSRTRLVDFSGRRG